MLKIFLRITIFIGGLFKAASVFAIDAGSTGLTDAAAGTGLSGGTTVESLVGTVLKQVLGYTGIIFFVLVVYAGLMWMTSAGNEEAVTKSKKILIAAMIGLVIVLSAYAITTFVGNALG